MARSIKHKLLQVMLKRDADRQLTAMIEIGDIHWVGDVMASPPARLAQQDPLRRHGG
jgi:hypothetical protein